MWSGEFVPSKFGEEPYMNILEYTLYLSSCGSMNYKLVILWSSSQIHIWASTYHVSLFVTGLPHSGWFFKFHPHACENQDSIIFFCRVVFHCLDLSRLLYPFAKWGASMLLPGSCYKNNAAMNIVEHMSLFHAYESFGSIPKSGIAGSCRKLIPIFLRNCHTDLQNGCTSLHSQECSPFFTSSAT